MGKDILVTGDLVYDYNLIRLPGVRLIQSQLLPRAIMEKTPGNAWYLAELVDIACNHLTGGIKESFGKNSDESEGKGAAIGSTARTEKLAEVRGPKGTRDMTEDQLKNVAKAYSIWLPFERTTGSREKVWRIERFLGCQQPDVKMSPEPVLPADYHPDLLVFDDQNLGFRDDSAVWKDLLHRFGDSADIFLKSAAPLGQGGLWNELFEKYHGQLTVVVSAKQLRTQYAAISEALSWDLAIEELQREFQKGYLAHYLQRAKQAAVYFGGAGVAIYEKGKPKTFIFHPEELEGVWHSRRPGLTYGDLSILTAALARYRIEPDTYPLFMAVGRALSAIREAHEVGYGKFSGKTVEEIIESFDFEVPKRKIAAKLHPPGDDRKPRPENEFKAAFPAGTLPCPGHIDTEECKSDLLQDFTREGYEYVSAKAMQVVIDGPEKALASVPRARYGAYLTVDREEIERINELRLLILSYRLNFDDLRPLSIAVFGPPGSGKSFAIKQLAKEIVGNSQPPLEFNLSQFSSKHELHRAFHQVRDASLKGSIPLVFWDEFDTDNLKWLKEFLAPMQDAEFLEEGVPHPFGKAIFVFAGGTYADFRSFDRSTAAEIDVEFRMAKGPDFVSRLRGYVNIKGPNPLEYESYESPEDAAEHDPAHLIRRAILLRSIITRFYPHLIDPSTDRASISSSLVRGFLRANRFYHGARSLEAIVHMSSLANTDFFGVAELPSPHLLNLHVSADFMELVREGDMESETIEIVARARHEAYGNFPGKKAKPWEELDEVEKERDRVPARATLAMLQEIGYDVVPLGIAPDQEREHRTFTEEETDKLVRIEHELWLRNKLMQGYSFSDETNDDLLLNQNLKCLEELPHEAMGLNRAIVEAIPEALWEGGYGLTEISRVKVGVVGHRILMDLGKIRRGINRAVSIIRSTYHRRPLAALSALALGADRMVAEAVLETRNSELIVVIPFELSDYLNDFKEDELDSIEQFNSIFQKASNYENEDSKPGIGIYWPFDEDKAEKEKWSVPTRDDGYGRAGRYIVDNCDVLVAVWDGQEAQGRGGTGEIVARARSSGKPVVIVRAGNRKPDTREPTTLGEEQGKVVARGLA